MKRILMLLIIAVTAVAAGWAQQGLNINRLFDGRYRNSQHATEIVVTGRKAQELKLRVYHSLTITGDPAAERLVSRMVTADGSHARTKDVEWRKGQVYYGFYQLAPVGANNRYIFFLNQNLARRNPQSKVTLIYMEGPADSAHIKRLIGQ